MRASAQPVGESRRRPIDAKGQLIDRSAPDRTPARGPRRRQRRPVAAMLYPARQPAASASACGATASSIDTQSSCRLTSSDRSPWSRRCTTSRSKRSRPRSCSATSLTSTPTVVIESCVLGGACDGRVPSTEPAVVEGAPPVPMTVKTRVVHVRGEHGCRPRRRSRDAIRSRHATAALRRCGREDHVLRARDRCRRAHLHADRSVGRDRRVVDRSDRRWHVGAVSGSRVPPPRRGTIGRGSPRRVRRRWRVYAQATAHGSSRSRPARSLSPPTPAFRSGFPAASASRRSPDG